ncbi:MurE-like ligase [Pseudobythopirellula maris]|uniref:MurE-like ligase n=1 Tax=Pseudobythopirellula maris TaxID=2527991 RepID=A0A5C5ZRY3_9BACT|nr:Mur ligase family protein [Pseudobythopirellula maris]TWT90050.1 MurE-like ligase [Pseudobythopirellula maris]
MPYESQPTSDRSPRRHCQPTPTVAVAGAHGKTSVATLLSAVFAHGNQLFGLKTTRCERDGAESRPVAGAIGPGAIDRWRKRCDENDCDIAVAEAPAGDIADGEFSRIGLVGACLTGLRCERTRRFPSVAMHRHAIEAITAETHREGFVITNADDPACVRLASTADRPVLTFGLDKPADFNATAVENHSGGQVFVATHRGESAAISSAIPGEAHRRNCLAAVATAVACGVDFLDAVRGAESVRRLPGVMQSLTAGQNFPIYFDSARSAEPLRLALRAMRPMANKRVLSVVTLDDSPACVETLSVARSMSDRLFVIAQSESLLTASVLEQLGEGATLVEDRLTAIALAVGLADEGDAVLVAGAAPGDEEVERAVAADFVERRLQQSDDQNLAI